METAVSQHMGLYHNFDPQIQFSALDHIPLMSEVAALTVHRYSWKYNLNATVYPSLKKIVSFKPFL